MTAIREGVCDGFVIGGGVSRVLSDGNLAARAQMPFWLQMVGTGLTATFAAHLGAVLKQARWPAIPCVNIYSHVLVQEFAVEGGHLRVPEAPGLGSSWTGMLWSACASSRILPKHLCAKYTLCAGPTVGFSGLLMAVTAAISPLASGRASYRGCS